MIFSIERLPGRRWFSWGLKKGNYWFSHNESGEPVWVPDGNRAKAFNLPVAERICTALGGCQVKTFTWD